MKPSLLTRNRWLLAFLIFLVGCGTVSPVVTPTSSPTQALRDPSVSTTRPPDPRSTVQSFLDAWKAEDYVQMYSLVTTLTHDALSEEDFTKRYTDAASNLTLVDFDYEVLSAMTSPSSAQVGYRVNYHTAMLGDLQSQMAMNLSLEDGAWKVQWEDGLILSDLKGGNHLVLDLEVPARGNIYDRNGHALAAFAEAIALGVVPGNINEDTESTLVKQLSELTGKSVDTIRAMYENASPEWYVPIGETSAESVQNRLDLLTSLEPGLSMSTFRSRYYFDGGIGPHAVGYVQPIYAEEWPEYQRQGYLQDAKVGKTGLEYWGEEYLRGTPKAALYVDDAQGNRITMLAQSPAEPAQSIYTTLDSDFEEKIQKSMGDYRGAVVVMERNTGRVLAMVSSPTFDPNLFEPSNFNSMLLGQLQSDTDTPLLNRATQGQYPLGSVFKIVTMSAALESGMFTKDSTLMCERQWNGLDRPLNDWTYEKDLPASGLLTLPQGLIRSCNPWFWQIGLDIFRNPEHALDISKMARAFGLGSPTGIEQVSEEAGLIPDPLTDEDSVQLAIGQATMLVTPLQVARFVAAVGNGGTLYRPNLVDKIAPLDGDPTYTFKPVVDGTLPVSAENLKIIQDAMVGVVESTNPLGTAHYVLANVAFPIAGKTGTAQNSTGDPHAWFAGYTFAEREDLPDIAVAVLLENAGEGSEMAAPLFRRVVQLYISQGQNPGAILPWESTWYVPKEEEEETETPEATPEG